MRFLAVDDEQLILERLVGAIEKAKPSAEVVAFEKPMEALEYAKTNRIDVAFLDIQMRVLNGIELAKEILKIRPETNIVFCTGYSEYYKDAFELYASAYLEKPIKADKVTEALEHL